MDVLKAISPISKPRIIGIRSGEKLHEEMITSGDSINTIDFKDYYVIMPASNLIPWDPIKFINESSNYKGKRCTEGFCYNSKDNKDYLSINKIRKLISINKNTFLEYKE